MGKFDTKPGQATEVRARELAEIVLAGARVLISVTVPRTEIHGRMRVLSRAESTAVLVATRKHFADAGMPDDPAAVIAAGLDAEWNDEWACQHLAIAVRDPKDESKPLGDIVDWRDCDDGQIAELWNQYQDLRDRLDPIGEGGSKLSDQEAAAIDSAAKKSEFALLRSFGSSKLARYVISTAARPAT